MSKWSLHRHKMVKHQQSIAFHWQSRISLTASAERGVIEHLNGTICLSSVSTSAPHSGIPRWSLSTYLVNPGSHRISGSTSRPSESLAFVMSKQNRVDAMDMTSESIAKKRPGHILYDVDTSQIERRLGWRGNLYEPSPESEIGDGVESLGVDFTAFQKSFWIERVGVGVVFLVSQECPRCGQRVIVLQRCD